MITPVLTVYMRLRPDDLEALKVVQQRYGFTKRYEAIRFAARVLAASPMLTVAPDALERPRRKRPS